ncbi:MAG: hypothetical protein V4692_14355 [Bdellovibrionota bacterium]
MRFFTSIVCLLLSASSAFAQAPSEIDELRKRLDEIEKRQKETFIRSTENRGSVKTYLGESLALGGFFETGMTAINGENTETQMSVNAHVLGINIAADFNERLRFVSQTLVALGYNLANPNNNPTVSATQREYTTLIYAAIPAQAYIEYSKSDLSNIQVGLGYVPFGRAYQQRELVLFARRGGPQMIGSGSGTSVGVANPLWMGVHAFGSKSIAGTEGGRWGYDLYTHTPSVKPNTVGVGGRLWKADSEHLTYGYSIQSGTLRIGSYVSHGVDLALKYGEFAFVTEGAYNRNSNGDDVAHSFYFEPSYTFSEDEFLVFVAADYLDNPTATTVSGVTLVPDAFRRWLYGAGFNWIPVPFTRYRIAVLKHDYIGDTAVIADRNRDYYSLDLSAGIAF